MYEIKKFPYTDILGWSASRYDRFSGCKRQYFYDYYAKYDTDVPLSKITALKQLTSQALETGNIAHDVIRDMLQRLQKTTVPINIAKLEKYVYDMTQKYCNAKTFSESYYDGKIISADAIYNAALKSVKNFIASPRFDWVISNAKENSALWVIEPEGYGETRIEGLKAYCKVDFLLPAQDGKVYIFDWKTGKPDHIKHAKQLAGYALWANCHFGTSIENTEPVIIYLMPDYNEVKVNVGEAEIKQIAASVKDETRQMYAYLKDIEKNVPLPKEEFEITTSKCRFCNYKEICTGYKGRANRFLQD